MNTLTMVRHGESVYNIQASLKEAHPLFAELKRAYNRRKKDPEYARAVAEQFLSEGPLPLDVSDYDTPVTEAGRAQSVTTGQRLPRLIRLPDVVLVSPYLRTQQTLGGLAIGWPELSEVETVVDDRLREQEHGTSVAYNDWRVFHLLNPEEEAKQTRLGRYNYRYPSGENVPDVRSRTRAALDDMQRDYVGQEVLVVSHHLQILSTVAEIDGLGEAEFMNMNTHAKPANCGVTIYRADGAGGLASERYNERLY